uniref:Uncharacterized protein n=1 Tax=Panagrolaimus sp. PS1159 TaxID=55785 RepID=A0AC35GVF4_9BILA
MQFNGNAQSIQYPLTLTCDTTTNLYTYNNSGIQTQISSAQCCRLTCGTINRQPTQVDNIFAPDASCTYHRILSCIDGSTTLMINAPPGFQTGVGWPGPETFPSGAVDATCPAGATVYVHNSPMFGANTPVGKAQCP